MSWLQRETQLRNFEEQNKKQISVTSSQHFDGSQPSKIVKKVPIGSGKAAVRTRVKNASFIT